MNGNVATMVLAGSFMKYRNGVGMDNTAMIRIFSKSAIPRKFHNTAIFRGHDFFTKQKYATGIARMPVITSKFLPSKVI